MVMFSRYLMGLGGLPPRSWARGAWCRLERHRVVEGRIIGWWFGDVGQVLLLVVSQGQVVVGLKALDQLVEDVERGFGLLEVDGDGIDGEFGRGFVDTHLLALKKSQPPDTPPAGKALPHFGRSYQAHSGDVPMDGPVLG